MHILCTHFGDAVSAFACNIYKNEKYVSAYSVHSCCFSTYGAIFGFCVLFFLLLFSNVVPYKLSVWSAVFLRKRTFIYDHSLAKCIHLMYSIWTARECIVWAMLQRFWRTTLRHHTDEYSISILNLFFFCLSKIYDFYDIWSHDLIP